MRDASVVALSKLLGPSTVSAEELTLQKRKLDLEERKIGLQERELELRREESAASYSRTKPKCCFYEPLERCTTKIVCIKLNLN